MKAVIYARYSCSGQREESIEGQIRECTEYAKRNDIQIVGTYADKAKTGKNDNRFNFQRMISDSSKNLFDIIIVWKLDRFARNKYDSAHYKHLLSKNKIRVVSATEMISDSPEGALMESLLEGMAEYYSLELAVKVERGQIENALKGCFNGGTVPLGYRINQERRFEIDHMTAPFVLKAFELYDSGSTMKEIAEYLKSKGVKNNRGTPMTLNTVSNMLTNRRYIGEYSYKHVFLPDGIPAIISKELFERVQRKIAINRKSPAKHKAQEDYILSTKLYCGTCMTYMVGESGTSQNQTIYRYYKCLSSKRKRGCDRKAVKKDWIEDIVIEMIMKLIWDDALIERLTDLVMKEQANECSAVPLLKKQLKEVEKAIANVIKAIEQGVITPSTKSRLEELENEKEEIEKQIIIESLEHPLLTREQVMYWFYNLRTINGKDLRSRKMLVDCFVNSVILHDDRIDFYFNYKEGAKTLSLKKLKKSSDMLTDFPPFRVFITDFV